MKKPLKRFSLMMLIFLLAVSSFSPSIALGAMSNSSNKQTDARGAKALKAEKKPELSNQNRLTLLDKQNKFQKNTDTKNDAKSDNPRKSEWNNTPQKAPNQSQNDKSNTSETRQNSNLPNTRKEQQKVNFIEDEIIVKFKQSKSVDKVRNKYALKHVKKLPLIGAELVKIPKNGNVTSLLKSLKADPAVEFAQPNFKYYPSSTPNDPNYNQLWGLHNTGQSILDVPGLADTDVDAPEAWSITEGSQDLLIAVIDTGVDIKHPDLKNNIWVNPNETPGNGIDDDGNGYVDDVNGWDFFNNDNSVFDQYDGDDHGTHVSGTIAGSANNSLGIVGIAPNVKIMPLKFLGPYGGSTADAILAIQYASSMGAKISNNSWGGSGYDQALKNAIETSGMLFVAAAGNDSANSDVNPSYPAGYDSSNILSVASVNNAGELSYFSNYGVNSVDVAAPGQYVLSTVPKKIEVGAGIEVNNGTYKAIFNGFGFENLSNLDERQDAFNRALSFLGATSTSKILLVQDDQADYNYTSYLSDYSSLLVNAGYTSYNTVSVATNNDGPSLDILNQYDIVVWFTGDAYGGNYTTTLTANDQTALTGFVNNGGNLLLTGPDAIFNNEFSDFVQNVLHVDFKNEGDRNKVVGVAETSYAGASYASVGHPFADQFISNDTAIAKINLIYPGEDTYDNAYEYYSGTSMATPHVTGVASLLYSQNPDITAEEAIKILKQTGKPLPSLQGIVASGKIVSANNALNGEVNDNDIPGVPLEKESTEGSLDELSDTDDVFSIELEAGETLTANLTGDTNTDFDLYLFSPESLTVQNSKGIVALSENVSTSSEDIQYVAPHSGTYYLDVFAYTGTGNYTLTVEASNGPGTYEDNNAALVYTGAWEKVEGTSYSNETAKQLNSKGSVKFTFVGSTFEWIGFKNKQQGIAHLYVDGELIAKPSLYSGTSESQQVIYSDTLPHGKHTVEIQWTGVRDPLGRKSGTYINIDSFIVQEDTVAPSLPTDVLVWFDGYMNAPAVEWTPSEDSDVAGYKIYRRDKGTTEYTLLNEEPIAVNYYYDATASVGKTYDYAVSAVDFSNNESSLSTAVTYTHDNQVPGIPFDINGVTGALGTNDWVDVYGVQLEAGKTYTFKFTKPVDTDFSLALFHKDTSNVYYDYPVTDTYYDNSSSSYFSYSVKDTGTYYLAAYGYNGSGEYSISLVDSKTTTSDNDIPGINLENNKASDYLDYYDFDDVYSMNLNTGDTITINLSSAANNGNDFDLYLYSPDATTVDINNQNYLPEVAYSKNDGSSAEEIVYTAEKSGTYYIDVNQYIGSGPYDLSVSVQSGSGEPVVTRIEENNSVVKYNGSWTNHSSSLHSGGTMKYTNASGTFAELTFTGNEVKILAMTSAARGLADVYIDGVFDKTIDLYSSSALYQAVVYEKKDLSSGSHTIKMVWKGQKSTSATSTVISLDAFEITEYVGDTEAPTAPSGLITNIVTDGVNLNWDANSESDLAGYNVYRWEWDSDWYKINENLITTTTYTDTNVIPGESYGYGITAIDKNGNESGFANYVYVDIPTSEPKVTRIEENDLAVKYNSSWTNHSSSLHSGGTMKYTNSSGAFAELAFTGNEVKILAMSNAARGLANIYIDGVLDKTIDLYSSSTQYQSVVYEKKGLSSGSHTIKMVWTGNKSSSATSTVISLDAFEITEYGGDVEPPVITSLYPEDGSTVESFFTLYGTVTDNVEVETVNINYYYYTSTVNGKSDKVKKTVKLPVKSSINKQSVTYDFYSDIDLAAVEAVEGPISIEAYAVDTSGNISDYVYRAYTYKKATSEPVITRIEENDSTVKFNGSWTNHSSSLHSGSSMKYTNSSGAFTEFTFTGNEVKILAMTNAARGIADIYIDGVFDKSVDLYSSSTKYQEVVYEKNGLSTGSHTIKMVWTGKKSPSATSTVISLDAFEITSY